VIEWAVIAWKAAPIAADQVKKWWRRDTARARWSSRAGASASTSIPPSLIGYAIARDRLPVRGWSGAEQHLREDLSASNDATIRDPLQQLERQGLRRKAVELFEVQGSPRIAFSTVLAARAVCRGRKRGDGLLGQSGSAFERRHVAFIGGRRGCHGAIDLPEALADRVENGDRLLAHAKAARAAVR
jgi:hypothetical protein